MLSDRTCQRIRRCPCLLVPPFLGCDMALSHQCGAEMLPDHLHRLPHGPQRSPGGGGDLVQRLAVLVMAQPEVALLGREAFQRPFQAASPLGLQQAGFRRRSRVARLAGAGALLLGVSFFPQRDLPSLAAAEAAEGWAGDSLLRYRAAGRSVLGLRVRFRDPKDAGEFAAAHLELLRMRAATFEVGAAMTTATRGDGVTVLQLAPLTDEVTIVFADDPASAAVLAGFLLNR